MPPSPVERTGGKKDVLEEDVTDAIARETAEFIARNKQRLFFLYLPTTAVVAATGKPPEAADGVDLVPYPRGGQGSPHETLVSTGAGVIASGADCWVVRHGRWKLIGKGDEPSCTILSKT
ncbi:MAG: hypothetical protein LW698_04330 [Planctomycetaceae bacterium]|jgi:hypothetical protein|nr:hypothetical protein [Planctomycetaceae bacterium]